MTIREEKANEVLQNIAHDIQKALPNGMGFTLLAYEFNDDPSENGKMLYVSNSKREDVINAMLEFVEKNLENPEIFGKEV